MTGPLEDIGAINQTDGASTEALYRQINDIRQNVPQVIGSDSVANALLPDLQLSNYPLNPQLTLNELVNKSNGLISYDPAIKSELLPSNASNSSHTTKIVLEPQSESQKKGKCDFIIKTDGSLLVSEKVDLSNKDLSQVVIQFENTHGNENKVTPGQIAMADGLLNYLQDRIAQKNPNQTIAIDTTHMAGLARASASDGQISGTSIQSTLEQLQHAGIPAITGDQLPITSQQGGSAEQNQAADGQGGYLQNAMNAARGVYASDYYANNALDGSGASRLSGQGQSVENIGSQSNIADMPEDDLNAEAELLTEYLVQTVGKPPKHAKLAELQKSCKDNPAMLKILTKYAKGEHIGATDVAALPQQMRHALASVLSQVAHQTGRNSELANASMPGRGDHTPTAFGLKVAEIAKGVSAAEGKCATADQITNEKLGHPELSYIGNAWESHVKYDKSPYVERVALSAMAPGDKLIRKWSDETNRREGNKDYGDVMTITRVTADGRIFGVRGGGEEEIKLDNPRYSQKPNEMLVYRLLPTKKDNLANNPSQLS